MIKIKNGKYIFGIVLGLTILVADFYFLFGTTWFFLLIVVSFIIGSGQYLSDFFNEIQKQKEIEERFPEFVRNLVGAVDSGMHISRAIVYVSNYDYGALTPHVRKLANQVEWAIPLHKALKRFADATKSRVIKRAIATLMEAKESGGNIEDVLKSITSSVVEVRKIKKERSSAVYTQIIQSYIIYFIFIAVIIVIQKLLVPYIEKMQNVEYAESFGLIKTGFGGIVTKVAINYSSIGAFSLSSTKWFASMDGIFLAIIIIQGFFSGIVLGKIAEGSTRYGIRHSVIMMTLAFLIIAIVYSL